MAALKGRQNDCVCRTFGALFYVRTSSRDFSPLPVHFCPFGAFISWCVPLRAVFDKHFPPSG